MLSRPESCLHHPQSCCNSLAHRPCTFVPISDCPALSCAGAKPRQDAFLTHKQWICFVSTRRLQISGVSGKSSGLTLFFRILALLIAAIALCIQEVPASIVNEAIWILHRAKHRKTSACCLCSSGTLTLLQCFICVVY